MENVIIGIKFGILVGSFVGFINVNVGWFVGVGNIAVLLESI